MPKKMYTTLPTDYPVCMHSDCPLSASCTRQVAFNELVKTEEFLQLINPNQCARDDKCRYYRQMKSVSCAIGFTNFQRKMFPDQYRTFMDILVAHFGRNPYYERRRGDTPLSPKEQRIVMSALRKAGVKETLSFDAYEDFPNWYD